MRYMIPIFQHITGQTAGHLPQLRDHLLSQVRTGSREIDILQWMTGTALELVGQGGLGYSFDALNPNSKNEYGAAAKLLAPILFGLSLPRQFLPWFRMLGPHSLQKLVAKRIPSRRFQKLLNIVEVIDKTSKKIFTEKTTALAKGDDAVAHQVGEGRDIMSVLLKANMEASAEDKLQDEELLGQMNTILFAAMDTTSNALCRIFQLLSQNQDVQDKLRAEIVQAREATKVSWITTICTRSRIWTPWAPLSFISRTARADTILPLGTPVQGEDGSMITELFVPKNTDAIISIIGTNRNPSLWGADAREWKPERWLSPLPESVTSSKVPGVYANLMTFLGGGRSCIGFKFSQLEMKVVLSTLLPVFRFSPAKEYIVWRLGGIANPTVEASGLDTPAMPMQLSIVN
ncbi:hypothetical protein EWM64_g2011 [Hericium alpestre]|uniref:Cytochrome P450 n=1 Tax=Hericium alpestre TaxID=135208 RepID=A0A4Z0A6V5_9AGAM|nr:hypothetical protein EWM64_g2011 [Hericium alpestre]